MLYVFDLDGTLADCKHRLHYIKNRPKNFPAFYAGIPHDTPIHANIRLLQNLWKNYNTIIFCTGRPETERESTTIWIKKHIPYLYNVNNPLVENGLLYMRPDKDYRPDFVVKAELAKIILDNHGEIDIWFDDRTGVVKELRKMGINVFQVASDEIEVLKG